MTRVEETGQRDLGFSRWLRANLRDSRDGLTITDLDWVLYDYKRGLLMLVEVKTKGAPLRGAQERIYNLLDSALSIASPIIRVENGGKLQYLGYHHLELSGTTPDNSIQTKWNGKLISKTMLMNLLNMDQQ